MKRPSNPGIHVNSYVFKIKVQKSDLTSMSSMHGGEIKYLKKTIQGGDSYENHKVYFYLFSLGRAGRYDVCIVRSGRSCP